MVWQMISINIYVSYLIELIIKQLSIKKNLDIYSFQIHIHYMCFYNLFAQTLNVYGL